VILPDGWQVLRSDRAPASINPPPLVLRVLGAVHQATRDKMPPDWVDIDTLRLRVDRIRLSQAVGLAVASGWLSSTGGSPLKVAITADGLRKLGGAAAD
jgi:hypothetical protein